MTTNFPTIISLILIMLINSCKTNDQQPKTILDKMAINLSPMKNRAISFTNKEAAYYYTQSHINDHPEHAYFAGLTIAKEKIFNGYDLFVEKEMLDNSTSTVKVFPHKMVRKHQDGTLEEFWMFDHKNALKVALTNIPVESEIRLRLHGLEISSTEIVDHITYFTCKNHKYIIAVSPLGRSYIKDEKNSTHNSLGFLITVAESKEQALSLIQEYSKSTPTWEENRESRMQNITSKSNFSSSDDSLNLAVNWLSITMDQLVTRQHGHGIYAGLPWFAEYWGRDQFISLPGACLVNGEFEVARKILRSFAEYQDKNPASKFFGRVPNIVNPSNIDYHTTDGTPRLIIQLREYVKYSGDTTIIRELYENVKYSIDGSIKNWTDEKGYLLHEDNETWMDARRNYDKMPYSPRGTRANDIQALWHDQLLAGVYFATYMNDNSNVRKWKAVADKVKSNFENDFTTGEQDFIADRLDQNNNAEFRLRPNQLFTFNLLEDPITKQSALKKCWSELVYPWGVASLNRQDEFFHPFHKQWENYHKDEGYHNGTIWLWLNGIAMQRMLEFNQRETAYKLFNNMNRQALTMGVVGGMAENMDAYPRPGEKWPKLTGTYLQAWSNAEQLRVWYQYFLGMRPDMVNKNIVLAPRIPAGINDLQSTFYIGDGHITFNHSKNDSQELIYTFTNLSSDVTIDIVPFDLQTIYVNEGNTLKIMEQEGRLKIILFEHGPNSAELHNDSYEKSDHRKNTQSEIDQIFKDVQFCSPLPLENHKVLNKKFTGNRGL